MLFATYFQIAMLFLLLLIVGVGVYLLLLVIRALRKYLRTTEVRREKEELKRSLGEVIREYRTERKMTQEFVAESLGVSRQAVSKWESGASEPSTSNLLELAKLFEISPGELLQKVK